MNTTRHTFRCGMITAALILSTTTGLAFGDKPEATETTETLTHLRMSFGRTITAIKHTPKPISMEKAAGLRSTPYPRPRLDGFSPLVAITTSSKQSLTDLDFEQHQELSYDCSVTSIGGGTACGALNPPSNQNFVVGILDSGSDVNLAAGTAAQTLGLTGANLTGYTIPIGGVGGEVDADVTQPVGFYAAGLDAVSGSGILNMSELVGHSNVSAVASPAIVCDGVEAVSAVVGRPFMILYNAVMRVDQPRTVTVGGRTYNSPQVDVLDKFDALPDYDRLIAMEFGGQAPATTASYYPDFEDLETPQIPTLLSLSSLSIPFGGAFFTDTEMVQGEPSGTNPLRTVRMMVDTGAQSSIISPAVAAQLNLPITPDFTVNVCGAGGLVEDIPGYYITYVRMNALGGALQFSEAPFVVLDLASPEGGSLDGVLGMNFFYNRNVIFEGNLTASSFLHVTDPIAFDYCDFDLDFDSDVDDQAFFSECLSGVGITAAPQCLPADGDDDGDVDLFDFAMFQQCHGSPATATAAAAGPESLLDVNGDHIGDLADFARLVSGNSWK